MTASELTVVLGDAVAGTLTRQRGGRLRFEYDSHYRASPNATPLSLSMPIEVAVHGDEPVRPWLLGLLPDNDAVLRRWGRAFSVSASSPFALLGTPVGEDCAGAVRFAAPDELDRVLGREGNVEWLSAGGVARRLRALREDSTTWLGGSFTGQFSLAGAQAKTALLREGRRWGVPSGATPTTHILKPAVAGLDGHDLNEHLCLDAARRAGLIVARSAVGRFAAETAVVVTRYDRIDKGEGGIRRVHQEDLCQALGLPPDRKYQNEGGPTPAQIARLLRGAMPPGPGDDAVRRFTDAMLWNWLIGGTDAHAKNYSLLLSGSQARLAPLYDIASALPYGTHEKKLRLAMKLGSTYEVHTRSNPLPGLARDVGLDLDELTIRARALAGTVADTLSDAANTADVAKVGSDMPARLTDLVAKRARRCLRLIA